MRLTNTQIKIIHEAARQSFGADIVIWLFGSRTDDKKRGGDVDLYIETSHQNSLLSMLQCKIALEELLDLSVDLIVKEPGQNKPIYTLAKSQGIQL